MSAAGGVLNRIVGSLGGAQTAAVLVIGGIVVGGATGGALTSGALSGSPATTGGELSVYPCPDVGPALFTVPGGQKFLVTGKTVDGSWLRIHNPLPGRTEAWVPADPLTVKGSMADLPVAECAPELAILASPMPAPTLTAIQDNSPSPSPTPVPTATPTATPVANTRPSLSALTASTRKINYDTGAYCPNAVKKVTFKVKATDAVGVEGVTLFWRKPGAAGYAQSAMSRTAGTAKSGTWQVTLNTTANDITSAGRLAYYAVATDADGATRRLPTEGSNGVTVAVCVNTGPTIKSASSSSGKTLGWNPLGAPNCQMPTTTTISAAITDVDGVETATLYFRRPGDASWSKKPMALQGGRWSAPLDVGRDKITIPDPPTGTLRWYIKAADRTGLTSQTKAASITIKRCDSEALFEVVRPTSQTYSCSTTTISIETWATDRDQPEGGLKVVFYWKLSNADGQSLSGHMSANPKLTNGNHYEGTAAPFNGKAFSPGTLSVYAVTTDKFGGTTKSSPPSSYSFLCR